MYTIEITVKHNEDIISAVHGSLGDNAVIDLNSIHDVNALQELGKALMIEVIPNNADVGELVDPHD